MIEFSSTAVSGCGWKYSTSAPLGMVATSLSGTTQVLVAVVVREHDDFFGMQSDVPLPLPELGNLALHKGAHERLLHAREARPQHMLEIVCVIHERGVPALGH